MSRRNVGIFLIILALIFFVLLVSRTRVYEVKSEYIIGEKEVGYPLDIYSITGEGIGTFNVTLNPTSKIEYRVMVGVININFTQKKFNGNLELWVIRPQEVDQLKKFIESGGKPPSRVYAAKQNITELVEFQLGDTTQGFNSLDYDGNYTFAFIYYAPTDFDMVRVGINIWHRWLEPKPWNPTVTDKSLIVGIIIFGPLGVYFAWKNPSWPKRKGKLRPKHPKQ